MRCDAMLCYAMLGAISLEDIEGHICLMGEGMETDHCELYYDHEAGTIQMQLDEGMCFINGKPVPPDAGAHEDATPILGRCCR